MRLASWKTVFGCVRSCVYAYAVYQYQSLLNIIWTLAKLCVFVCAGELAVRANAVACDCLSTSPNTNNLFCLNTCSNLWQRIAAQYGSNEMEHPDPDQKIRNRFSSCQGAELPSCVQYMSEGRCRRNSKASKCDPLNQWPHSCSD